MSAEKRAKSFRPPAEWGERKETSADDWAKGNDYEAYMGRWSRPLAREFVRRLGAKPKAHWLEVGCGTGALTSAVCNLCDPATIVACDPSPAFVAVARGHVTDGRASFEQADDSNLPTREGGFDIVVSGLVLNFLPDPARGLSALRERLRSGGMIAAYVWDYAEGMEFLRRFWDAAVELDPEAASLDEGRRFPLCRRDALESLFRAAGLAQVKSEAIEQPTEFEGFDDFWAPFLGGIGPAPAYVASLDGERRESLRARLARDLAPRGGPIRLRARAFAVRGERPSG